MPPVVPDKFLKAVDIFAALFKRLFILGAAVGK